MPKVKLLKDALVSSNVTADRAGTVVEVDDQRARDLISAGIAEATTGGGKDTAQGYDSQRVARESRERLFQPADQKVDTRATSNKAEGDSANTKGATDGTDATDATTTRRNR